MNDNVARSGKPIVYIATPYSPGNPEKNVKFSCKIFNQLVGEAIVTPIAPLWAHFQNKLFPRPVTDWLQYDSEIIKTCNACLRLNVVEGDYQQSESPGADKEVELFREAGKPVFFSIEEMYKYYGRK